jgi:hypothetical protein
MILLKQQRSHRRHQILSGRHITLLCLLPASCLFLLPLLLDPVDGGDTNPRNVFYFHRSTRRYILEDRILHNHRCENLSFNVMCTRATRFVPSSYHAYTCQTCCSFILPCVHVPHILFLHPTTRTRTTHFVPSSYHAYTYHTFCSFILPCVHVPHILFLHPTMGTRATHFVPSSYLAYTCYTFCSFILPCVHVPHVLFLHPTMWEFGKA